ncbi:apolipoprotein N-acyltransferase [Micromonospora peucetia]|uniref:Apolipoprotein N-acyltransferase n=1 Tax=Micromonospora peucetia TaxID=47871 RepID=A0A1C6W260_9ACTN|nr:apolipoprotein N-acyltransferase [Micromonospora peucetia]WSA35859.1 apolipoprotein N-acyltransferase [Micromonospora peucetia]SCL72665.1 apolipoprotein N-acyltransferase [Micromonospora peucetia]
MPPGGAGTAWAGSLRPVIVGDVPAPAGDSSRTSAGRAGTPDGAGRALPLWVAVPMAVAAGLALLLAFPPYGLWPLAPLGVALLAAATHRRRMRAGAGLGFLTGVALFAPLLSWTNLHTGYLPWVLLSLLQAGYLALLGAAGAYASPLVDRLRWSWPAVTGVLWVGQEALRDRTPFGGFPWGRLAFSQDDSPLLRLAAWGGAPLVTFAVALTGGLLAAALWRLWDGRRRWVPMAGLLAAAVAVPVVGLLVPVAASGNGDAVTVAIVQGNVPRLGLDFNAQRQAVLNNHVDATIELAGQVAAGARPRPDLVVWPENSSDIDPLRDTDAGARISQAADAVGAPILVGAVLRGPGDGEVRNAGILWRPGTGPDLEQLYTKRHPVPFAEYVPMRDLARMVSKQVDRVRADFVPGTEPGVLDTGAAVLGDVICFEVAYDEVVRDTVTGGAQLLVVQTNNATFDVAEARQQLAMVRLRAIEHGRPALMASTVGVSGFVAPDGRVSDATGFNTRAVVVRQLRLDDGRTLATRVGLWPEVALATLAVAALVGAAVLRRRHHAG